MDAMPGDFAGRFETCNPELILKQDTFVQLPELNPKQTAGIVSPLKV